MKLLELYDVTKSFIGRAGIEVRALRDVSFSVEEGEYVAVMGESGSGKTTLLNLIAALINPTSGTIIVDGKSMENFSGKEKSLLRRKVISFIYQDFKLLENYTVEENILMPLILNNIHYDKIKENLAKISAILRIENILSKYPDELSGGEKQKAAIGRAIISSPRIILADEPTGSMDSKSARKILDVFDKLNGNGQTIIMVTHSILAASKANRVLFIKDGKIYNEIYRGTRTKRDMYHLIGDTLSVMETGGEVDDYWK